MTIGLLQLFVSSYARVTFKAIPPRLDLSLSSWKVDKLDGKGYGIIATRDISIGECVMEDIPVIKMSAKPSWFVPTESRTLQRINDALTKVSKDQRTSYLSLHAYSTSTINDDDTKALAVFRTNAYPLHSYQNPDHNTAGVYLNISRLNSACAPNVYYSYDSARECGTIYCIKPIQKDEEILNTYISLFLSKLDRLNYLSQSFGFQCDCKACQLQGVESELSDQRRQRLRELESICQNRIERFDNISSNGGNVNSISTTNVSNHDTNHTLPIDINQVINERLKLLSEEGLSTASTLYKVYLDAFLLTQRLSMKQFIGSYYKQYDANNSSNGNNDGKSSSNQSGDQTIHHSSIPTIIITSESAITWLKKATECAILCKGQSSTQVAVCQYYLDQYVNSNKTR